MTSDRMNRHRIGVARGLVAAVAFGAVATLASAAGPPETKAKPRKGMELPPELQTGTTEAKVTHRKLFVLPEKPIAEMMQFDPYRVVDFRRGWMTGSSGSLPVFGTGWTFQWEADDHTYAYSFDVVTPEDRRWACTCAAASSSRGTLLHSEQMGIDIPGHGQAHLACVLRAPDGPFEWRLEVGVELKPGLLPTKTAQGLARLDSDVIALAGTERMAKWGRSPGRLIGFVMKMNDRAVAAVDIMGTSAVIFGADLAPGLYDAVAAIGAALLLFPDELDPTPF
jgi:hypothetical protein